jgi:hypothetical protein
MLVQLVVQQTGMPQADAEKRVDDAFSQLKAAEQKAREAAEAARKAALIAAFAAAAILAVSCAAACGGAALGARHRDENTLITLFGSRRFWFIARSFAAPGTQPMLRISFWFAAVRSKHFG